MKADLENRKNFKMTRTYLIVIFCVIDGFAFLLVLGVVLGLALLLVGGVIDGFVDGFADLLVDGVIDGLALLFVHSVALQKKMIKNLRNDLYF